MKKASALLAGLILLICATTTNAQQLTAKADSLNKRPQGFYFELLGPGGLYSVNYDTRFNKTPTGLGIRAGLSYTHITDVALFTLPVQLNYLLGKNDKFFELGLGATYGTASLDFGDEDGEKSSGSTVFGTMTFGYRKQPVDGGFMFRGGASPVFGRGFFLPYYGYISLGYSF